MIRSLDIFCLIFKSVLSNGKKKISLENCDNKIYTFCHPLKITAGNKNIHEDEKTWLMIENLSDAWSFEK